MVKLFILVGMLIAFCASGKVAATEPSKVPCTAYVLTNVTRAYVENKQDFNTCAKNSFQFFPPHNELVPKEKLTKFCYDPSCRKLFKFTYTIDVPDCTFNGVNLSHYFHSHVQRCKQMLQKYPAPRKNGDKRKADNMENDPHLKC